MEFSPSDDSKRVVFRKSLKKRHAALEGLDTDFNPRQSVAKSYKKDLPDRH